MPESRRPAVGVDALAAWCRHWLGAPPAAELFGSGYLSAVTGLRLADGREVVVKVRPYVPRLAGCAVVHRALWTVGFPCPEPLVDLQPLDGYRVAAAVRDRLRGHRGDPVIGHGDWHPENLHWHGSRLTAVHDGLWQRAFDARTRSLDGDPEQILTRHEAGARLRLAGLDPDLAEDVHQPSSPPRLAPQPGRTMAGVLPTNGAGR